MTEFLKRALTRARRHSKKYSKNQDGATAIEFALVAIPFFALIFAIIELSIIFFIGSALSNAVSEAGRLIRVGQFQGCGGAEEFKTLVCENMDGLGQCSSNLRVDVLSQPNFSSITPPDTSVPEVDEDGNPLPPGSFTPPNGSFSPSIIASTPVVIQATFYYRLALPAQLTRLESSPGSNIRTLKAITAFQTEPYPPNLPCPPTPPAGGGTT